MAGKRILEIKRHAQIPEQKRSLLRSEPDLTDEYVSPAAGQYLAKAYVSENTSVISDDQQTMGSKAGNQLPRNDHRSCRYCS